jgi:N utilization substance protein B
MDKINTKTIARIAAVQALYQYQINDNLQSATELTESLVEYYADTNSEMCDDLVLQQSERKRIKLNINYFTALMNYTLGNLQTIDSVIQSNIGDGWEIEHLHTTLMAVLRVGICELQFFPEVPHKVVINEFTDIASDILKDNEVAFVNSILDKSSKILRSDMT